MYYIYISIYNIYVLYLYYTHSTVHYINTHVYCENKALNNDIIKLICLFTKYLCQCTTYRQCSYN